MSYRKSVNWSAHTPPAYSVNTQLRGVSSLPQVFSALRCNALHVPFRNSKLTLLLQPCLSGDAKVPAIFL